MYTHPDKDYFSNKQFAERTVNKYHGIIQDQIKENIEKYNFQIEFIEDTWVLKQEGGGFCGHYDTRATLIKGKTPFGVLSVNKDKKKECFNIHVWSDGCCNGQDAFLINVPEGSFNIIDNRKCECHERDSSYVCQVCYQQGYRGHMQ